MTDRLSMALGEKASQRLRPELSRLDIDAEKISQASSQIICRQKTYLDSREELMKVLSPTATLRRGYSITRVGGHAVTSASEIQTGTVIVTTLFDGKVTSVAD